MTAVPARPADPRSVVVLVGLLVLCVGGGAAVGLLVGDQAGVYARLDRPGWAPPTWLFAPVWTVLYALMATSAWLVWRASGHPYRSRALVAFGLQLALNFLWTPAFFGAESPTLGLVVIVGVLLAAGWWAFEAWRVRAVAGGLQIPYLLWVLYATALNIALLP